MPASIDFGASSKDVAVNFARRTKRLATIRSFGEDHSSVKIWLSQPIS
jgi:hypothetical protein